MPYFKLRSTKQLLGRAGERFLLFGMLSHSKEGKLCLEDEDGPVELDFSHLVSQLTFLCLSCLLIKSLIVRTNQARVSSQKVALL
jgi:hypothetical protein